MSDGIKTCWLHVGMHKTGTTSIQHSLLASHAENWEYITLGGYKHVNYAFFAMFDSNPIRYHWFEKRGETEASIGKLAKKFFTEFHRKMSRSEANNFVISGEAISHIDENGIKRLKIFLDQYFGQVNIIGYVRSPKEFFNSMQQQSMKMGKAEISPAASKLNYRNRFEKFDTIFGEERVHLSKFSKKHFVDENVVNDFCQIVGWPISDVNIIRVNESLSREASAILLAYRKYGHKPGYSASESFKNNALIKALMALGGRKFILNQEIHARAISRQREDIRWMQQRLDCRLIERNRFKTGGVTEETLLAKIKTKDVERLLIDLSRKLYFGRPKKRLTGVMMPPEIVAAAIDQMMGQTLGLRYHIIRLCRHIKNIFWSE